eukprot:CAMPEP_0197528836 /NCGR_PEP_ID=MMETSP1318-20131121/26487_1 /TAXON_ID=552666 /ORGANISM="Partenskyella glossopodia, Strain RCC365" /LENGTH=371 /DNA_ID=CAMNT_0043084095 /DNA_START=226 /DNA_END=1342 /DNA_ORIENTATION=-
MSFLKKISTAFVRVPKSVDAEYDQYVETAKSVDSCLRRIEKQLKPMLAHLQGFSTCLNTIMKEVECLSEFKEKGQKQSRPWNHKMLKESQIAIGMLTKITECSINEFKQNTGQIISSSKSSFSECKRLGKIRDHARDDYDRQRQHNKKIEVDNDRKRKKGSLTQEDKQKEVEVERGLREKKDRYIALNSETKSSWNQIHSTRNDTASKLFQNISEFQKALTSNFVTTMQLIDYQHSPSIRDFYLKLDKVALDNVPKIKNSGFSSLHNSGIQSKTVAITKTTTLNGEQRVVSSPRPIPPKVPRRSRKQQENRKASPAPPSEGGQAEQVLPRGIARPPEIALQLHRKSPTHPRIDQNYRLTQIDNMHILLPQD